MRFQIPERGLLVTEANLLTEFKGESTIGRSFKTPEELDKWVKFCNDESLAFKDKTGYTGVSMECKYNPKNAKFKISVWTTDDTEFSDKPSWEFEIYELSLDFICRFVIGTWGESIWKSYPINFELFKTGNVYPHSMKHRGVDEFDGVLKDLKELTQRKLIESGLL